MFLFQIIKIDKWASFATSSTFVKENEAKKPYTKLNHNWGLDPNCNQTTSNSSSNPLHFPRGAIPLPKVLRESALILLESKLLF